MTSQFFQTHFDTISADATKSIAAIPPRASGMNGMSLKARIVVGGSGTYDDTDFWDIVIATVAGGYTVSACNTGLDIATPQVTLSDGAVVELPIQRPSAGNDDTLQVTFTKHGSAADLVDVLIVIEGTPY